MVRINILMRQRYLANGYTKNETITVRGNSMLDPNLTINGESVAVDENGNKIDYEELQGSTGNEKIFDTTKNTNNPFSSNSIFDENRRVTIKHTIQTTLSAAIGSYNEYSGVTYEFALPVLEESDWDKIQNHICVLSFYKGYQ